MSPAVHLGDPLPQKSRCHARTCVLSLYYYCRWSQLPGPVPDGAARRCRRSVQVDRAGRVSRGQPYAACHVRRGEMSIVDPMCISVWHGLTPQVSTPFRVGLTYVLRIRGESCTSRSLVSQCDTFRHSVRPTPCRCHHSRSVPSRLVLTQLRGPRPATTRMYNPTFQIMSRGAITSAR